MYVHCTVYSAVKVSGASSIACQQQLARRCALQRAPLLILGSLITLMLLILIAVNDKSFIGLQAVP